MEEKAGSDGLKGEPPDADPATLAFSRLGGEIAMMRRAIEHLAAKRVEISIPDYSSTFGEMTRRLVAIERKPAMQMTPRRMAERITAAAVLARQEDQHALAEAKRTLDEAVRAIRTPARSAVTIEEQNRRLRCWTSGGFLLGCVICAVIPGCVARALPERWHLPERLAARTVRAPSLWYAGARIMRADNPQAWRLLVDTAGIRRDNRDAIDVCERQTVKVGQLVRCMIEIRPISGEIDDETGR